LKKQQQQQQQQQQQKGKVASDFDPLVAGFNPRLL